jgi:hypothetical protein
VEKKTPNIKGGFKHTHSNNYIIIPVSVVVEREIGSNLFLNDFGG